MGEDLFCEKDEKSKFRFYDITVTASDSAGNTGSDTCKVIIVPSCSRPPFPDGCERFKAGNSRRNTFYYTVDFVKAAVFQSKILYQVAEAELVWKHDAPHKEVAVPYQVHRKRIHG